MNYQELSDDELLEFLATEEDRLPRIAVDEFIKRGERLVGPLSVIVSESDIWEAADPSWWATVHSVFILGAIGGSNAILPLLKSIRFAAANHCDWVTERLPAIFGNIGVGAIPGLTLIANDKTSDWYVRTVALEGLASITVKNPEISVNVFTHIYSLFMDAEDDKDVRSQAGNILLDFKRTEHKEALLSFAREEEELKKTDFFHYYSFGPSDVERAFREERYTDLYIRDWLSFYDDKEIEARQKRWKKEDEREKNREKKELNGSDFYHGPSPYTRETSKIGRNDPCPCGSGKKFKKCCGI